jgi:HAE1 family hydrophobic/amphiphilic exporter-1
MQEKELTVQDITGAIQSQHAEVPAGYIDSGDSEMNVRVTGEAGTTGEFSSLIIPGRKGQPLWRKFTIGDVGTVEDGLANVRRLSRAMGQPTVSLGIRKQRGTNAVEVAKAVKTASPWRSLLSAA